MVEHPTYHNQKMKITNHIEGYGGTELRPSFIIQTRTNGCCQAVHESWGKQATSQAGSNPAVWNWVK